MCIYEEGVSADSCQENPPPGTIPSPQCLLSLVTCQMRTETNFDLGSLCSSLSNIDKEFVSLTVCEIKTTPLRRQCAQYLDKRTVATKSTFQQVFLTFRPHRVTFHICDVLGVDSRAQHSHRQLICE